MRVENWLPIPGFEGRYCVSDHGNVMSMNYLKTGLPGLLRQQSRPSTNRGYLKVSLSREAKQVSVHILVMLAFVGPRPKGHVINHIDGNKANNHLSNLEYCTQSENVQHAIRTGLRGRKKFPSAVVRVLQ